MNEARYRHICEVCGKDEILTPTEGFADGWDYPPRMGQFGVVGPRTCGSCSISATVWWAIAADGYTEAMLSEAQKATITRIVGEPETILV